MKLKKNHPIATLILLFLLPVFAAGCVVSPVNWTGSVDAIFKYNAKIKTTVIHEIKPNSLSSKAGLKAKDELLAIDGSDITSASYEEIKAALRGPTGSFAVLTVKRNEKILEIKVERKPAKNE